MVDIDLDSTAVLAFDDGARVPCDRYLMRLFCDVLRSMLENTVCDQDARGRTVIPMPGQPSKPFGLAVRVLHGLSPAPCLGLEDTQSALECMAYLGATAQESVLESRLSTLLADEPLGVQMQHASRLLRNKALAGETLARLIRHKPMWIDFHIDVLMCLDADVAVVKAVTEHAPAFFPPLFVADWALDALTRARAAESPDTVLAVVAKHGVMYHPCEAGLLARRLARVAHSSKWPASLTCLLGQMATSMECFESVPWRCRGAHGSQVKVEGVAMASVALVLEGPLPRVARLSPWLRAEFCRDGRFDLRFKPRRIDEDFAECTSVQVRAVAMDRANAPRGLYAEAWHLFNVSDAADAGDSFTLSHAHSRLGDIGDVFRVLREKRCRILRLDFFMTDALARPLA